MLYRSQRSKYTKAGIHLLPPKQTQSRVESILAVFFMHAIFLIDVKFTFLTEGDYIAESSFITRAEQRISYQTFFTHWYRNEDEININILWCGERVSHPLIPKSPPNRLACKQRNFQFTLRNTQRVVRWFQRSSGPLNPPRGDLVSNRLTRWFWLKQTGEFEVSRFAISKLL